MKLKKVILSFLIMLLGLTGSLFGCKEKPLKLNVTVDNEIVSEISLILPSSIEVKNNGEENGENEAETNENENVDESKKTVYVFAENVNEMFKKGLIVSQSEQNIVDVKLNNEETNKFENCFAYDIVAIQPKDVVITFKTKDEQIKTELNVKISQDCEKIEKNIHSQNFVVKGENQQLSNSVVNFLPGTTTNKNIIYKLSDNYTGLELSEDGYLSFNENFDGSFSGFYIDVYHSNYDENAENKDNFVVKQIKFNIINKIDQIVATKGGAKIASLDFATNMGEEFDYQTIEFKKLITLNGQENYEDIDNTYELSYYLKNSSNESVVNIKPDELNKFALTISQNGRDGNDVLVAQIKNSAFQSYKSNEIEIAINVKTYPNFITINGLRQDDPEFIIYDNGKTTELEIKVSESFNTDFTISGVSQDKISLKYQNGENVLTETIKSGTKLYLSCADYANFGASNQIDTTFLIKSVGNENLTKTVKVKVIKSLVDVNIVDVNNSSIEETVTIYKTDTTGTNTIKKFQLTTNSGLIIPNFVVEIENQNIVKLENLTYAVSEKSFSLKALTTGTTTITVKFDNGLEKQFNITVLTAIKDVNISFSESSRVNIGKTEEVVINENNQTKTILKYYLKNDTISQLLLNAIDINDKPVYDKYALDVQYFLTDNDAGNGTNFVTLSNADNKLYTNKTIPIDEYVKVTAKITAYVLNAAKTAYEKTTIEKEFLVVVYQPIKNITLSDDYIELFAKDSLGKDDYAKSEKEIEISVLPANATILQKSKIRFEPHTDNATITFEGEYEYISGDLYQLNGNKLKITAKSLGYQQSSDTATIIFTIEDYGAIYTKRVTIKISKAIKPEKILVENVEKLVSDDTEIDYLYFNLGLDDNVVSINPTIYPLNSLNTDYVFEIQNKDSVEDIIKFNKESGTIEPIKAGECSLILTPKGCIKEDGTSTYQKTIKIIIGDGDLIPYKISSKHDLLSLCKINTVESENDKYLDRFSKKYVLTNDIDLSGETIYPIGLYKLKTNSGEMLEVCSFKGDFDGEFVIDGVKKKYSITGISFSVDTSSLLIVNNVLYLGLFAKNEGTISNLSLQYSQVNAFVSRFVDPVGTARTANSNATFCFGGVSAQNSGTITNCDVKINSCEVETYFGKNYVGGVVGDNNLTGEDPNKIYGKIENCFASGNLNIVDGFAKQNSNKSSPKILVGGIAGFNAENCQIVGEFDIYSNQNEIFNKNIINMTMNISSIYDGELVKIGDESAFGGICGENKGTIQNMASYGKVYAYQNVGGIAGINNGKIGGDNKNQGCFSASIIYANNTAGGLVGKNSGTLNYNAVMLLDDGDNFEKNNIHSKIYASEKVGGFVGINTTAITNNFVRSYVQKTDKYFDIYVESAVFDDDNKANFGGLVCGDINKNLIDTNSYTIQDNTNNNFADNLKIGYVENSAVNSVITTGENNDIGIVAPSEITVEIEKSTLNEDTLYSYNKFIKGDDETIVLYYYKDEKDVKNSVYNYYLRNYLLKIGYNPEDASKLTKIESSSPEILSVDDKGNFTVNKTGNVTIKIYSLLDKNKEKSITIKIVEAINNLNIFEDNLLDTKISTIYVLKDSSKNFYLSPYVMQRDLFVKFTVSNQDVVLVNSGEDFVSALNSQVLFGKQNGNAVVTATLYVLIDGKYIELPHTYSFNVVVRSGLKDFNVSIQKAEITSNSFVNFDATISTDLTDKTFFATKQTTKVGDKENYEDEYLKFESDKQLGTENINLSFKVWLNKEKLKSIQSDENGIKTITFKVYTYDSFVSLNDVLNDESKYSKYIQTIEFVVKDLGVINAEMMFFADGEVTKDSLGQEIINTNELESEYIKIGKIGILKILVYPKENLDNNKITLTYSNSDNLNLSFKQVKKQGEGYIDINTSKLIEKGIELDISSLSDDEQYLYVKLLTDSPIKEDSKFNLNLKIENFDYQFEKTLTSALASNLELSFDGAVLNAEGNLESVYAKGVEDQVISLTVNKLTEYAPNVYVDVSGLSGSNFVEVYQLKDAVSVGKNSLRYDYGIKGLNYSDQNQSVELYFYIDKTVNNKVERYKSNTLKLNVVDFVVKDITINDVENSYLTKPLGTSYPFKINFETINNGTSEVLNQIATIEEQISKTCKGLTSLVWNFNGESLIAGFENNDFKILKDDFFSIYPKQAKKFSGFSVNFAVAYKNQSIELVEDYSSKNDIFINDNDYCVQFNKNFGAEFYIQTDINNPVPIYSAEDFVNMKQNGNYILMNDIILQKNENISSLKNGYSPKVANFNSLDGNSYKVVIKDLDIDLSETKNEYSVGLFTEISENTLVKNLTVKLDLNVSDDNSVVEANNVLNLQNISNLTFGTLCAVNNGLIYNCEVSGIKTGKINQILYINLSNIINDEQTKAKIGGVVGINEGIITNSRSELMLCVNKGFVGGFVAENIGTISSSYYKNMIVKNLGEDENSSSTAGFVYNNEGIIKFSYVEGNSGEVYTKNGVYTCDSSLAEYTLSAPTSVAGFVFTNGTNGDIQDCYANLSISSQSYSGGFVFENLGQITRCYSASINEKENNTAHAPFIATKVSFDEKDMKNKLVDCFYLNTNKTTINDNVVTGLSLEQFKDEYYLTNFVFDGNNCIWALNENKLPSLVEANNIAISKRSLYQITETEDGSVKYSYIYNDGYYAGNKINPIIISSKDEFIEYFAVQSKTNSQYYRLINNINFSDYATIPTYTYVFSGRLDGNGLEISNVRISAPSNFTGEAFGMFAKIEQYPNGITPIVKNIELKPLEVYANNSYYVGTLAGIVKDANILNINIDGASVIVQGRNIVGGVVGYICGKSNLVNITSNVSVNSNYSSSSEFLIKGYNLFYSYLNKNSLIKTNAEDVSYAGSVCGVVDIDKNTQYNEGVRNITVLAGTKSIATFAGFGFGLVCENSGIDSVKVNINNTSYLNANYSAGYVCGENRGYISRVETKTTSQITKSLFKNNCKFVGGIVGFNNNGTVVNSLSSVNVIGNDNTLFAGGVIGLSVGGACSSVVASNDVFANQVVGGIVGMTARRDMFETENLTYKIANTEVDTEDAQNTKIETIKTNNIMYIANCVAINNFCQKSLDYINQEDKNHFIGAIIGAAHNTPESSESSISVATKNSYIAYNNYYLSYSKKFISTSDNNSEFSNSLQDYGVNNIDSFEFEDIIKNTSGNENYACALAQDKLDISVVFKNWSNNIFDFSELIEISKNNLNLPKLKSVNNINTKKLEGLGTFQDPYRVDSVRAINELSKLVENGSTNIYVNVTDNIEATGKEFNNIGDGVNKFDGTFNGNGYFINGLTYFNVDNYNTQNYFGLFGYVSSNSKIQNLNVVANFVINYVQSLSSSSVTSTGIIAGYNEGYIANCNTYGGMICTLKNNSSKVSLSYIGGICGINGGKNYGENGLFNCKNYATIYITTNDVELATKNPLENVNIYAGFIAGANLNEAIINKCENQALYNLNINKGASEQNGKNYTLIVVNDATNSTCKNFVNTLAGFVWETENVYGDNSACNDKIYSVCYDSISH